MRTAFHEQAYRHATSRTSVRPEYHIIGFWVMSALEKVKEQVPGLDVDVARVHPATAWAPTRPERSGESARRAVIAEPSALLDAHAVPRVGRVRERGERVRRETAQVLLRGGELERDLGRERRAGDERSRDDGEQAEVDHDRERQGATGAAPSRT